MASLEPSLIFRDGGFVALTALYSNPEETYTMALYYNLGETHHTSTPKWSAAGRGRAGLARLPERCTTGEEGIQWHMATGKWLRQMEGQGMVPYEQLCMKLSVRQSPNLY